MSSKKKTSIGVPEGYEGLVEDIRAKYPALSLAKVLQARATAGAEYLSTADESAVKDALLKA